MAYRNKNGKSFMMLLSGLLVGASISLMASAYTVEVDVSNAVQRIRQIIVQNTNGNTGIILNYDDTGSANFQGSVEANQFCDQNGNNCANMTGLQKDYFLSGLNFSTGDGQLRAWIEGKEVFNIANLDGRYAVLSGVADTKYCTYDANTETISCEAEGGTGESADTNYFVNGIDFQSGVLILSLSGSDVVTGSLDGRYMLASYSGDYYTTGQVYTKDEADGKFLTGEAWDTIGSDVYYNGGNVGIGLVPENKLDIKGFANSVIMSMFVEQFLDGDSIGKINFDADVQAGRNTLAAISALAHGQGDGWGDGSLAFYTSEWDNGLQKRMTINQYGNVGIGTDSPGAKLAIEIDGAYAPGGSMTPGLMVYNNGDAVMKFKSDLEAPNNLGLLFENTDIGVTGSVIFKDGTKLTLNSDLTTDDDITILDNGNVGIGTATPAYKLEVDGNVNFAAKTNIKKNIYTPLTISPANSDRISTDNSYIRVRFSETISITVGNGDTAGQILVLEAALSAETPSSLKISGDSDLYLQGGSNSLTMSDKDTITLIWNGSNRIELNRSDNSA